MTQSLAMRVRSYVQQVPYRVIKADEKLRLTAIEEKPIYSFNVNAGFIL